MSAVTKELRKQVKVKAFRPPQSCSAKTGSMKSSYRKGVKICLERARLLTESYKKTEGQPMVLRRAKGLANILENMTIYIKDRERIVGNFASSSDALTTHPELYWRWLEKSVQKGGLYSSLLNDQGRKELEKINQYWKDRSVQGVEREKIPERVRAHWRFTGAMMWGHYAESGVPDYRKIFNIGLNGIIKEAKSRLVENERDTNLLPEDFLRQKNFLEASIIALESAVKWGKRYSRLTMKLAKSETNLSRKKELEQISEICDWVPGNPPRSLCEAIQCFWFIHIIHHLIEIYQNGCAVRLDQLLYPIYKREKELGDITRENAQELLEFLCIKMEDLGVLLMPFVGSGIAGNTLWQTITLCGTTKDAQDATNEMSFIILDACKAMKTIQPSIALRYHDKIDPDIILSAIDLLKTGVGYPAFFNDKAAVPLILGKNISVEKARDYGIEACMRWTIPGESMAYRSLGGILILPKCLELALYRGIDKTTGNQIGEETADPVTFKSINDVKEAFLGQVDFFIEKLTALHNLTDILYREYVPRPFLSALLNGCIEKGRDCRDYSFYHKPLIGNVGGINVTNSLAAMQKLVFEKHIVSMDDLLAALRNNWEGEGDLRQLFLQAPKFGNDNDYADKFAQDVYYEISLVLNKYRDIYGFHYNFDGSSASMYYGYNRLTGATPDGRKDGENFGDGIISPTTGTDVNGPTAVLKSCSKIDPVLSEHTLLLNQKFQPQYLDGEYTGLFTSYLKSWADLGLYHIQFNITNRETLVDAQKYPAKHTDLIVRVAGYSAYFNDLDKGLQDDIIRRTEQYL